MKFGQWTSIAISSFAILAMTIQLSAQDNPDHKRKHHQYKLIDLGTFGGPNSGTSIFATSLTVAGTIGAAQTPVPDPYDPNCLFSPGCFVTHAFRWQKGVLTDLGALPGTNSSYAYAINNNGLTVGISENGSTDPQTGYPEVNAVVWNDGKIINLGTFGGTQTVAENLNDRGQVVGMALNAVSDPYSEALTANPIGVYAVWPGTTQSRAFLWEKGAMRDLGTLGGPDALAYAINQRGQVAGHSYINSTPNPTTGIPTLDPFLWENGRMIDLGSLGGTISYTFWLNNRGQVVGYSDLPGDQAFHGFVWDRGALTDLSLGGSYAAATWINDAGDAIGTSFLPGDQVYHAFLWSHGKTTDLGSIQGEPCVQGLGINEDKQVVGYSSFACSVMTDGSAFLWENGGPMVDLNALIENPSNLHVSAGTYISDRGEIVALGVLPSGDEHAALLVPDGDCDHDCERRIAESPFTTRVAQPVTPGVTRPAFGRQANWLTKPFGQRPPMPGQPRSSN